MKFPAKLIKMIELRDTNQSRLMRETGISQSAISEMTLGKRRPYMDQAFRLARALGVPLDYLADDEQEEPPRPRLTADEADLLRIYRALQLDPDEALRRLAGRPPETWVPGAVRDQTSIAQGQPREQRRIVVRELPPGDEGEPPKRESVGPKGQNKGPDPKHTPRRVKRRS